MSIIYTLVANPSNMVLCEQTNNAGNFQLLAREVLISNKRSSNFLFMPIQDYIYYLVNTPQ
jgi:hypothetical protein